MGSLNYEGGWASQNPSHPMAYSGSRYFPPKDGDTTNHLPLDDLASQSFKEWSHRHPRAENLKNFEDKQDLLTSYPILQDKVIRTLTIMGGGYIILKNGFNFSPGLSIAISGFAGYAYYESSDMSILKEIFNKIKN